MKKIKNYEILLLANKALEVKSFYLLLSDEDSLKRRQNEEKDFNYFLHKFTRDVRIFQKADTRARFYKNKNRLILRKLACGCKT